MDSGEVQRTRDLVDAYLRGDSAAERRLFEQHRQLLVAQARKHPLAAQLARDLDAEDLADQALLRALAAGLFERFEDRGPGSLRNVLFRLLDRVVVDGLRRSSAARRGGGKAPRSLDAEPGDAAAIPSDASTPTSAVRALEIVDIARRELSERELAVWRLIEIATFDSNEAAAHLGMTPPTVRSLLRRARARLVRALAEPPDPAG